MPSLTVTPQYGDDQASAPIFTTLKFHVLSCSLLYQWIILASPISDTRIHYTWEFGLVYTVVPVTTDLLSLVCPLYGKLVGSTHFTLVCLISLFGDALSTSPTATPNPRPLLPCKGLHRDKPLPNLSSCARITTGTSMYLSHHNSFVIHARLDWNQSFLTCIWRYTGLPSLSECLSSGPRSYVRYSQS